jgi:dTDP-4-dehydrorhamnose reductase
VSLPLRIALFGADGQVGHELRRALTPLGEVHALNRADADFADPNAPVRVLDELRPQVVVIAAAYTAVDQAEREPDLCMQINANTPKCICDWASLNSSEIVYYSSDYIFDGDLPLRLAYLEGDTPNPQSAYGRSKLAGERAVLESGAQHLILRTSWVFGTHGGNFVKTILRLALERECLQVVADEWGAPTPAALVADVTAQLLRARIAGYPATGTYHLTAAGQTNWFGYARYLLECAIENGMVLSVTPDAVQTITAAECPTTAKRPRNSQLDTAKLRKLVNDLGLQLPHWQDGVAQVVRQLSKQASAQ